jgi:hypothetical protein
MLKCIKDSEKYYKGDEPSPKGLGFCAHTEEIGTIKNGLDGNKWIIVKTAKNIKRWIKYNNEKTPETNKLTKNNDYYKEIKKKYISYKTYFTHSNFERPYLIYIKNNDVVIYDKSENFIINSSLYDRNYNNNKWMYINLVKQYKVNKIFIGKSPLIKMTDFSGGHGKYFDGNTILLLLNNNNYIYIGDGIEKCKINDNIKKYFSFVGNNDVPYPMAIGEKNIYFFEYPSGYLPINEFPKFKSDKDLQEIFDKGCELDPFLISFKEHDIKRSLISLEEYKKIKNKTLDEISLDEIKNLAKMYSVTTSGTKKQLVDRIEQLRGIIIYKK